MNRCCGKRKSTIKTRADGVLVTVTCICNKFIAEAIFENVKLAQQWSKEKLELAV